MFNRLPRILLLPVIAGPAMAQTLAKGDEITAAISDNTVQGSMTA